MNINRMAGCCLLLFGIINVLHEIVLNGTGRGRPGIAYGLVTAALFTLGHSVVFATDARANCRITGNRSADRSQPQPHPGKKGPQLFKSKALQTGRDDWIRTSDLTHPKRARYQAAPRPV